MHESDEFTNDDYESEGFDHNQKGSGLFSNVKNKITSKKTSTNTKTSSQKSSLFSKLKRQQSQQSQQPQSKQINVKLPTEDLKVAKNKNKMLLEENQKIHEKLKTTSCYGAADTMLITPSTRQFGNKNKQTIKNIQDETTNLNLMNRTLEQNNNHWKAQIDKGFCKPLTSISSLHKGGNDKREYYKKKYYKYKAKYNSLE